MKIKDLFTNLMSSLLVVIPLFYLFIEWFYSMTTTNSNFSHFIDIMIYPIMALLWILTMRGKEITKFVIWSNRVVFILTIVIAVMFFRTLSDGTYIPADREVTEITQNNTKYFVTVSDTLDYYIDKNDTTVYDTSSWKVYLFVREDMFKDTIYGGYSLSNGDEFLHLKHIERN